MTLGSQTIFAERLARSSSNANSIASASDVTKFYINAGVLEFSKKVHGVPGEAYVTLAPQFDIDTNFAVRFSISGSDNSLTATDVLISSNTVLTDATPTTVASALQSALNAAVVAGGASGSVSLAWSASTWIFYFDAGSTATSCYVGAPQDIRYVDACPRVFGSPGTKATSTFTGSFPEDCNMQSSLPTGFLSMDYVEWNGSQLDVAPQGNFLSPQVTGTPSWYCIRNRKIRINPVPDFQSMFHIQYKYYPPDLATDGSEDTVSCPLAAESHMAPVYWAASCLLDETHEQDKSIYYQRKFYDMVNDYKIRESNQNPTLFPKRQTSVPYKVESSAID